MAASRAYVSLLRSHEVKSCLPQTSPWRALRIASRAVLNKPHPGAGLRTPPGWPRGELPPPGRPVHHLPTLIEICFGLASAFWGRVTLRTPSLDSALIFPVSTTFGSVNERLNEP